MGGLKVGDLVGFPIPPMFIFIDISVFDGLRVGFTGAELRSKTGDDVGTGVAVGVLETKAVGRLLGKALSNRVGEELPTGLEGTVVGLLERMEGDRLGTDDTSKRLVGLGVDDGKALGDILGSTIGFELGRALGDAAGTLLGRLLG